MLLCDNVLSHFHTFTLQFDNSLKFNKIVYMKITKITQKKWVTFKKNVIKRKKRLHIFTQWSYQLDKNTTDGNIRVSFSVPVQSLDDSGELITRQKQRKLYLKNRTFKDLDLLIDDIESVSNRVQELQSVSIKGLRTDEDEKLISYWIDRYCNRHIDEMKSIKMTTIISDTNSLKDFQLWLSENKPKLKTIYKINKELLQEYFTFRMKIGGVRKKWSAGGVRTSYRRIRAFYNWLCNKRHLELEFGILNKMGNELPKVQSITESFSPSEIATVYQFMLDEKDSREWGWFIPMLRVLLLTGCRISECVNMKIDDIDLDSREWFFKGKGDKKRRMPLQDKQMWNDIESRIVDLDGYTYDKEFVFHQDFWVQGFKGIGGYKRNDKVHKKGSYEIGFNRVDMKQKYTTSGLNQKFKKMVRHLNISDNLSPHSCRRYYITEMLKMTNGNIPLVSQLVGHATWDVVRMYSKSVITSDTETNINLEEIVSKTN